MLPWALPKMCLGMVRIKIIPEMHEIIHTRLTLFTKQIQVDFSETVNQHMLCRTKAETIMRTSRLVRVVSPCRPQFLIVD